MKYDDILIDAPWRWRNWTSSARAVKGEKWGRAMGRPEYDCMNQDDLCALPVGDLAAKDCALFSWATFPKLPEALETMNAWGFTFTTCAFVWVKLTPNALLNMPRLWATHGASIRFLEKLCHFGLGYYTHGCVEICLLGKKGHPRRADKSVSQLIFAPRGAHSAKPAITRRKIEQLMGPGRRRIELFARERAEGWSAIGNEIEDGLDIRHAIPLHLLELESQRLLLAR